MKRTVNLLMLVPLLGATPTFSAALGITLMLSAVLGVFAVCMSPLRERLTGTAPVLLCEVNVRPRNDASLHFHHSIGFREVGQQDTDGGAKTVSLLALPLGVDEA